MLDILTSVGMTASLFTPIIDIHFILINCTHARLIPLQVRDTRLVQQQEKIVELHNGCICCTLREALLTWA